MRSTKERVVEGELVEAPPPGIRRVGLKAALGRLAFLGLGGLLLFGVVLGLPLLLIAAAAFAVVLRLFSR